MKLHCGIQLVPHNGTGRFHSDADALFLHTEMLSNYWPTHSFLPLFRPAVLDRMPDFTGDIFEAQKAVEALEPVVEHHATLILDQWRERFGLDAPPGPLRIFVDLEKKPLGRHPYSHDVYGRRDVEMMTWLCHCIERLARERGWVVFAAPYRPLRPTGFQQSRPPFLSRPMPEWWIATWGHPVVRDLLLRPVVWVHLHCPQDPAMLMGATHEDFAWRQITYAADEIRAAGGDPDELWMAIWLEDEVRAESMAGLYRGVKRGRADAGLAAEPHVTVNGGWKLLRAVDPSIHRLDTPGSGSALKLSVDHASTGRMMAEVWNAYVAAPFT